MILCARYIYNFDKSKVKDIYMCAGRNFTKETMFKTESTSLPVLKGAVVFGLVPFTSSKQWSLYTTTLNTHWVRVGRVVML